MNSHKANQMICDAEKQKKEMFALNQVVQNIQAENSRLNKEVHHKNEAIKHLTLSVSQLILCQPSSSSLPHQENLHLQSQSRSQFKSKPGSDLEKLQRIIQENESMFSEYKVTAENTIRDLQALLTNKDAQILALQSNRLNIANQSESEHNNAETRQDLSIASSPVTSNLQQPAVSSTMLWSPSIIDCSVVPDTPGSLSSTPGAETEVNNFVLVRSTFEMETSSEERNSSSFFNLSSIFPEDEDEETSSTEDSCSTDDEVLECTASFAQVGDSWNIPEFLNDTSGYVLVKIKPLSYKTKVQDRYFVAQITGERFSEDNVTKRIFRVDFFKNTSEQAYLFVENEMEQSFEIDEEDVEVHLPDPQKDRRGRLRFEFNFKNHRIG